MNIGFDYRMGGLRHGGIGRYAKELLLHLLELQTEDRFVVFYNDSIDELDIQKLRDYESVRLVKVRARHYSILEQIEFLQVLNKHKLDLVHFPNFNHPIFYKGKFVVTVHDMVHHSLPGHKPTHFLHYLAYKKVMEHAIKASLAVITPSEASKEAICKAYENFTDIESVSLKNKIQVIYEGVSLHPVSEAVALKVRNQLLLHKPYFLFVGTLERKKIVPYLARVFDKFIDTCKIDMDLVIAGKVDPHYPEEREKILSIKHKDHLILTGFVSDEELSALYQGAHAYVSLSPNEGFNLPGVEAMAFGLPVIAANTKVSNEIFDNGALYATTEDLDDAVEKLHLLARDKQFYERQAGLATARSAVFNWQKCAEETLNIYKQVFK